MNVTVNAVGDIVVDTASTDEDTAVEIDASTLLINDNFESTSTVTSVTNGSNGTAVLADGVVTYTPNADFEGSDTRFETSREC